MTSYSRLAELENDVTKEVTRIIVSEDEQFLLVTYKDVHEEPSKTGSIVLALMTTAYARMALYKVWAYLGWVKICEISGYRPVSRGGTVL